jgi:hypothetical protein
MIKHLKDLKKNEILKLEIILSITHSEVEMNYESKQLSVSLKTDTQHQDFHH